MGTKLQHAINLLAISPNRSSFSVHCVDDLDYLQTSGLKRNIQITGLDKFSSSMDRMPDSHNIDFIKKTMQMHEDIFKHQVRELHRLYSVQKMLMDEMKKEIKQNRKYWSSLTSSDTNHSQFINQHNSMAQAPYGYGFNVQSLKDDLSSRERSGSCSDETMRMTRGFDLERPADEDISTGVSAIDDNQAAPSSYMPLKGNKMSTYGSNEDSEVELTLSIGGSTAKKMVKDCQPLHGQELGFLELVHKDLDSPASFMSERAEDGSAPTTPMSSSSATFDRERKRPHWLFRSLSINRT